MTILNTRDITYKVRFTNGTDKTGRFRFVQSGTDAIA